MKSHPLTKYVREIFPKDQRKEPIRLPVVIDLLTKRKVPGCDQTDFAGDVLMCLLNMQDSGEIKREQGLFYSVPSLDELAKLKEYTIGAYRDALSASQSGPAELVSMALAGGLDELKLVRRLILDGQPAAENIENAASCFDAVAKHLREMPEALQQKPHEPDHCPA